MLLVGRRASALERLTRWLLLVENPLQRLQLLPVLALVAMATSGNFSSAAAAILKKSLTIFGASLVRMVMTKASHSLKAATCLLATQHQPIAGPLGCSFAMISVECGYKCTKRWL